MSLDPCRPWIIRTAYFFARPHRNPDSYTNKSEATAGRSSLVVKGGSLLLTLTYFYDIINVIKGDYDHAG